MGFSVIDAKSGSLVVSLGLAPMPGATGPLCPSDSLITAHARLSSYGTLDVCSRLKQVAASSPTRSGRCASVWHTLTLTGPSDAICSQSFAPRVPATFSWSLTSLVGSNSSLFSPAASPSSAASQSRFAVDTV